LRSGNSSTASNTLAYTVDTVAPVLTIALDDITNDNILNVTEAAGPISVTGTVSGDFSESDIIILDVNGSDYSNIPDASGNFSIEVPGAELAADASTDVIAYLTVTDDAGNATTVTDTQSRR